MYWTDRAQPYVLSLYRIVIGLLFACHGASSLFGVLGGHEGKAFPVGSWPGWWAGLIELVGGVLVIVGLGSRVVALICSGSMAYAYFIVHQPRALFPIQNRGELAAMFCWAFLVLAAFGPGPWSLDRLLGPKRGRRVPECHYEKQPV
jgi:putative oxidoreductase